MQPAVYPIAYRFQQQNFDTNSRVTRVLFQTHASTLICLPTSRSQDVALCLGAQAGPKCLIEVLTEAGFGSVRIATSSATNIVLEATN